MHEGYIVGLDCLFLTKVKTNMCDDSHDGDGDGDGDGEEDKGKGPARSEDDSEHGDDADAAADDDDGGDVNVEDNATLIALDAILLDCYNSVDRLLVLRAALSETLSKGWMDMARARYAMGPSRIGETLFSLKPEPPSILVSVSQDYKHSTSSTICNLDEKELHLKSDDIERTFARRFKLKAGQDYYSKTKPMILYGTLVSPHLRSAQSSFQTALKNLVEIANIQSTILNAQDQLLRSQKVAGNSS